MRGSAAARRAEGFRAKARCAGDSGDDSDQANKRRDHRAGRAAVVKAAGEESDSGHEIQSKGQGERIAHPMIATGDALPIRCVTPR